MVIFNVGQEERFHTLEFHHLDFPLLYIQVFCSARGMGVMGVMVATLACDLHSPLLHASKSFW